MKCLFRVICGPLLLIALALSSSAWVTGPPAKDRIDPASEECRVERIQLARLAKRYNLEIRGHEARIDRSAWISGPAKQDWPMIAWALAMNSACSSGIRSEGVFSLSDRHGTMLTFQKISTRLECHGDRAESRHEWTWYPC